MAQDPNQPAYADQLTIDEMEAARQEEYYWYCLHEFLAITKVFGQAKVLADLKALREQVEPKKEESRIQLI